VSCAFYCASVLTAIRGPRRPRSARWTAALLVAPALAGCTTLVPGTAEYAPSGSGGLLEREPCPDSEFECITLGVPADHFTPGSEIWQVTFALRRADVRSDGVFVVATGGPGSSGIAEADHRLAGMSPGITDFHDIVFFDQRGIGASEPFRCDDAFWFASEEVAPDSTPVERNSFARVTERFVAECFAEAGVDPADAERYGTRQAVEDLEAFRDWLDADQLILYGESYGTQFHQTYAAAHPDRVATMVLDGVVDLNTDAREFGIQQARAFSDVLAAVLTACDADPTCAVDAPGSALDQYDRLAAQLAEEAVTVDYPLPDGSADRRELGLADLHSAAFASVGDPSSRMVLQQALNAAARDNLVPLARLVSAVSATDPATGAFVPDPTFSDALYFAVQCADYDVVPGSSSGREQLDVWLDAAAAAGVPDLRLGAPAYGDLPCLFWPDGGARPGRPEPDPDPPYDLLLLGADTDPNTPVRNAEQVFERTVDDAALLLHEGGPHVIYGRGDLCVDGVVEDVVTSGLLPAWRSTACPGEIADPYLPLPPTTARGYTSGTQTVDAVLGAVLWDPLYAMWSGPDHLVLGCEEGGSARYVISNDHTVGVWLAGCAWTAGVPVDGYVSITDGGAGDLTAALVLPFADLSVAPDGSISGEFRGEPVG
jgi:pimeloyl-ACP methyl ester carboxylesterase